MRIWLALMPAALLAGVIAAGTAGAGTTRPSESLARTKLVKIKLPGPAQERVTVLTLTATSHDRAVGSLKVRSPNHAELPPEIRAVAVVNPPASRRRRAKFKVYVAIRNLAAPSTAIAAGALPDIEILSAAGQGALERAGSTENWAFPKDCVKAVSLGNYVDGFPTAFRVVPLRPEREQPSHAEEILDRVVFLSGCPGAEPIDDGKI